jgi:TorA maturation chaperone TorD
MTSLSTVEVRPVSSAGLVRALADLAARPHPGSAAIAEALELPRSATSAEHTELFDFQLYPYASVHLGEGGMLGGDARDRVAGFLRVLDVTPPPEPDHLVVLLHAYADLTDLAGSGAPRADHARRVLLHEHVGPWVGRFLARVVELGAEPLRAWARLTVSVLTAELAQHGPPPELPVALREAPVLPEPEDATAAEWTAGLLAPVRSGLVIARADLIRAARELELGARVGERAYTLRALLDQDARAVLGWLAAEAYRQADDLAPVVGTGGQVVADWWRARLERTAGLIARQLDGQAAFSDVEES